MTDFLNKDIPVADGETTPFGGLLYPWMRVLAGGGVSEFSEIRMRGDLKDKNGNEITGGITNVPAAGNYLYTGAGLPVTIGAMGVDVPINFPLADSIVAQLGTMFQSPPTVEGQLLYVDTINRVNLIGFTLNVTTAAATPEVVKVTIYVDGIPFNGGIISGRGYADPTTPTSIIVPLGGGPISAGSFYQLYIANMSSTNTITIHPNSFIGAISYTIIP